MDPATRTGVRGTLLPCIGCGASRASSRIAEWNDEENIVEKSVAVRYVELVSERPFEDVMGVFRVGGWVR